MGALSVRAGVIAADTTKEAHSNQKIDLTTVRWEVFRGTMDYFLRVWFLHCAHHTFGVLLIFATSWRLPGISIAGTEL
jgi:hypothetical protein